MTRPAIFLFLLIGANLLQAADPPAAKLVIQSAIYGDLDNDKTADVKQKIENRVKDENLSVKVDASTFGDPAPNTPKKLKVGYTIDGVYHSKTVEEGQTLDISAKLLIRKAVYGDLAKGVTADVTEAVAAMVVKNSLNVQASNDNFGVPAGGVVKKLRVDYTFDGKDRSKTVGENATLAITNKGE